jgi:hypothetical protein
MNEWYPLAIVLPGPSWKVGYPYPNDIPRRTAKGTVFHSMEGRFQDAYSRLMSTAQVSWHFSILYDGTVCQAYPLSAVCWHGGGPYVNCRWDGMEFEGRAGELLTLKQIESAINVTWWKAGVEGWP